MKIADTQHLEVTRRSLFGSLVGLIIMFSILAYVTQTPTTPSAIAVLPLCLALMFWPTFRYPPEGKGTANGEWRFLPGFCQLSCAPTQRLRPSGHNPARRSRPPGARAQGG